MNEEMTDMTNEEMFRVIMQRMDVIESGITNLTERMDAVENSIINLTIRMDAVESSIANLTERMDVVESSITNLTGRVDVLENSVIKLTTRVDTLEASINMEFWAVRMEMDSLDKSLKQEIVVLVCKIDRLMFSKDVDGYERMKTRVEVLEQGYQELREKTG